MNEGAKQAADVVAASTTLLTVGAWLPPAAALLTIVWTSIRIYEWYSSKK